MKQFLKSSWFYLVVTLAYIGQAFLHLHDADILSYILTNTVWVLLVGLYKYRADQADDRYWHVLNEFESYTDHVNSMMRDLRDVIIAKKRSKKNDGAEGNKQD